MHVETSRFGPVEVDDDEVVVFPDGLPGFGGRRRMILLGGGHLDPAAEADGQHTLFWLQDVEDPDLAFLTIVPWSAYEDYEVDLGDDDPGAADPDDVCVLAIVSVRREDGSVRLTANLLAPVVIDLGARTGRQVILDDRTWPIHAPLAEAAAADDASPEGAPC